MTGVGFDDIFLGQPARQLGHALDLVGHGAQLLVEGDPLQPLGVLGERFLAIDVPEEARVGQARGEDLAVAVDHARAAILRLDIGSADEGVGEFALFVFADEVLLVDARGQLNRLGRDLEEILLEPAEQRDGPFGQACVLDHQPLVLDEAEAGFTGDLGGARADQVLPFLMVDDDMPRAQLHRIVVGIADGDVARVVEAVAQRDRTAGDAVHFALDHFVAQQRDDARQRAHPAQGFGADRGIAPAHRLGPGKVADNRGNRFGEQVRCRAAGYVLHCEIGFAALDLARFEIGLGDARLAAETVDRLIGRADGRALQFFADGLGRQREPACDQREAARGRPDGDLARFDTGGIHFAAEQLFEFGARASLHAGGDFFAAQFEEEIRHSPPPSPLRRQGPR